jgi:hypothetical protein
MRRGFGFIKPKDGDGNIYGCIRAGVICNRVQPVAVYSVCAIKNDFKMIF